MSDINIVILGQRHVNSTIVVQQLLALGWEQNDLNEHGESVSVTDLNVKILADGVETTDSTYPDEHATTVLLSKLKTPWVLKDPNFQLTLDKWQNAMWYAETTLVWLTKDAELIYNSHLRRVKPEWPVAPIAIQSVRLWEQRCQRQYEAWRGPKIKISHNQIVSALKLFDIERAMGSPIPEETLRKVAGHKE